jgi:murein L,D-transpeptidase YafK
MSKRSFFTLVVVAILIGCIAMYLYGRSFWVPVYQKIIRKKTVSDVVATYGDTARERLAPFFSAAGINYPAKQIILLGLKDSAKLEVWAESSSGPRLIRNYPIRALSGVSGPKLVEGDGQVPEGLYRIDGLNPNSSYHLSMKLNYPNAFDLKHAKAEGRNRPGSNIFIHGKAVSIGCLAMGDSAIEELFVLASDVGRTNIEVAIAPTDPRLAPLPTRTQPVWVGQLYGKLNAYFDRYRQNEANK